MPFGLDGEIETAVSQPIIDETLRVLCETFVESAWWIEPWIEIQRLLDPELVLARRPGGVE
jgi:hypothetical protein